MSKNYPVPTNILISHDNCPLSSMFWRRWVLVENQSPVTIRHWSYSGLNRQLDLLYHFVSPYPPRNVMRSLVGVHFSVRAAEVVDAPLNCTASCQCALWSLRPFQISSFWRWSCDGKSRRIARPPSRTTAYRNCTVQPSPVILSCWRRGRVRCFCLGIYEESCINPIWNVGGPRLFWPKISKISRPIPQLKAYPRNLQIKLIT